MKIVYDEAKAVQSEARENKQLRRYKVYFFLEVAISGLFLACGEVGMYLSYFKWGRFLNIVGMLGSGVCLVSMVVLFKLFKDTPPDVTYRKLLKSHTVLEAKTLYDPEGNLLLCVTVEDDCHVVSKKYIPLPKGEIQNADVSEPTVNLHDGALYVPY